MSQSTVDTVSTLVQSVTYLLHHLPSEISNLLLQQQQHLREKEFRIPSEMMQQLEGHCRAILNSNTNAYVTTATTDSGQCHSIFSTIFIGMSTSQKNVNGLDICDMMMMMMFRYINI